MAVDEGRSALKTLRFEPLQAERIPAILEIERQVNTAPWSSKSFENEITNPSTIFLIAFVDGKVAGYGGVWIVVDEAHVTTLAVDPELQRQGIGRRLLVELLNRAKEHGAVCSTLEVRASNESAIKLYKKLGFVNAATRRAYYPDNKENAIVMWLYDLTNWNPPRS